MPLSFPLPSQAKLAAVLAQVEQEEAKRESDAAVLVAEGDRLRVLCSDLEKERDEALADASDAQRALEASKAALKAAPSAGALEAARKEASEARRAAKAAASRAAKERAALEASAERAGARVAELEAADARRAAEGAAAGVEAETLRVRLVALEAEVAQRRKAAEEGHAAAGAARADAERERDMAGALKARLTAALGAAEAATAEAAAARAEAGAGGSFAEGGDEATAQRLEALRARAEAAEAARDGMGARVGALEGALARLRDTKRVSAPPDELSAMRAKLLDAEAARASLHGELQAGRRHAARDASARDALEAQLAATHDALDEAHAREAAANASLARAQAATAAAAVDADEGAGAEITSVPPLSPRSPSPSTPGAPGTPLSAIATPGVPLLSPRSAAKAATAEGRVEALELRLAQECARADALALRLAAVAAGSVCDSPGRGLSPGLAATAADSPAARGRRRPRKGGAGGDEAAERVRVSLGLAALSGGGVSEAHTKVLLAAGPEAGVTPEARAVAAMLSPRLAASPRAAGARGSSSDARHNLQNSLAPPSPSGGGGGGGASSSALVALAGAVSPAVSTAQVRAMVASQRRKAAAEEKGRAARAAFVTRVATERRRCAAEAGYYAWRAAAAHARERDAARRAEALARGHAARSEALAARCVALFGALRAPGLAVRALRAWRRAAAASARLARRWACLSEGGVWAVNHVRGLESLGKSTQTAKALRYRSLLTGDDERERAREAARLLELGYRGCRLVGRQRYVLVELASKKLFLRLWRAVASAEKVEREREAHDAAVRALPHWIRLVGQRRTLERSFYRWARVGAARRIAILQGHPAPERRPEFSLRDGCARRVREAEDEGSPRAWSVLRSPAPKSGSNHKASRRLYDIIGIEGASPAPAEGVTDDGFFGEGSETPRAAAAAVGVVLSPRVTVSKRGRGVSALARLKQGRKASPRGSSRRSPKRSDARGGWQR